MLECFGFYRASWGFRIFLLQGRQGFLELAVKAQGRELRSSIIFLRRTRVARVRIRSHYLHGQTASMPAALAITSRRPGIGTFPDHIPRHGFFAGRVQRPMFLK